MPTSDASAGPPSITLAASARLGDGGQGLNLLHMLRGAQAEFEARVLCRGGADPAAEVQLLPPSPLLDRTFRLPLVRRFGDWYAYLADLHFDRQVEARLAPARIFQGVTGQCLRSLRRARELGARTVLDVVTVHVDDGNRRVFDESVLRNCPVRIHQGQLRRQREEYAAADLIRVMSSHARNTFLERGFAPDRVFALNPYLDVAEFPEATFREPVFRVCFVGRLVLGKGFHHVIEAFRSAGLPDSELVLWGGTGERPVHLLFQRLLAGARGIVHRPVPIRSVGLAEVFGRASVFVHPSLADGFGYSVAEAMASGLPAIVTRTTGAADWIQDGVNGFIVEPGDLDALRDRLVWCHAHPGRLAEMGRAARATVATYDLDRFRRTYLPHLRSLL